ncbi:MAG: lipoyl domain-containing protein [Eubacteriales bacterium]|nr:lipoyl domain-containing protein [Eubacteriales bacterium]
MEAKKVIVPRLAPNMESGVLVAWLKAEGDKVAAGDVLYEIETDKVVSQIEAETEGELKRIIVDEGELVSPGQAVAEMLC